VDHYEVLQISPNADQETIHRVYRIQAQRFHPDNRDHGDAEKFREIADAYQILSDPKRRAIYDAEHGRRPAVQPPEEKFNPPANPAHSVDLEKDKRQKIMGLLYSKRLANPGQPSLSLRELEDLMAIPKDQLEFSLWFLKEGGLLSRTDNARHTITMKGVELVESTASNPAAQNGRLSDGSRVA
jgi:curved DNA-binding protein CbpA